ncbi:MAG: hypothetical protein ACTS73_05290 [Arsenophonus sp. NEOnobi-MAG3]
MLRVASSRSFMPPPVVYNGYLSQRTIQTAIGDVEIKVYKVRQGEGDRSATGICFKSYRCYSLI